MIIEDIKKEREATAKQIEQIKNALNSAANEVENLKAMLNQATGALKTFDFLIKKEETKDAEKSK